MGEEGYLFFCLFCPSLLTITTGTMTTFEELQAENAQLREELQIWQQRYHDAMQVIHKQTNHLKRVTNKLLY